jgi:peroxiredoxin
VQLVELQGRVAELRKAGLGLVAVSYDPVGVLADFSKRRGITFPLLSDEGSSIIKQFGILNTTVAETNRQQYGIPFPGTFIVDRAGVVTARFFEPAYQDRTTVSSMMVRLGQLAGSGASVNARRLTTPHLQLTTYTTDQVASIGTQFSIVAEIAPARGIHVYAPGVSGYRPIALTIAPQPGLVIGGTHIREAPEVYHFKPLNERVLVYQKPFRIVQDAGINSSREAGAALRGVSALTINGTLDYQACDDRLCFLPQSVPISWTIELKPLDQERATR